MQGLVLKGVGSFYTVLAEDKTEYVCKARGKFRRDKISPVTGDRVEFIIDSATGSGFITEIKKRKNMLIRPAVANLDVLITVVSASVPKPDFLLVDKLLAMCSLYKISPVIAINKCDAENADELAAEIESDYRSAGCEIIRVSAKNGDGIEDLRRAMRGRVACFAGQSAVGKTSLLNRLMPDLCLETGDLSRKTERGRHTTRTAQLWLTEDGGAVLDTPGFTFLELFTIPPRELAGLYPEMRACEGKCRFNMCSHINEPDCAVKRLVEDGVISEARYKRYISIYDALNEAYKHRYD